MSRSWGREQIDYLRTSPEVSAAAQHAGIERRGHYAPRTWKAFDTVTGSRMEASDHRAVWVDLAIQGDRGPGPAPGLLKHFVCRAPTVSL